MPRHVLGILADRPPRWPTFRPRGTVGTAPGPAEEDRRVRSGHARLPEPWRHSEEGLKARLERWLGRRLQRRRGRARGCKCAPHNITYITYAVTGELLGPHAPSALLELSYPRSRARRVLKANGKPPASRGAPHRTRVEIRSGWDSASVGHLVCLVQTCVKGPLCYVMLC